MLLLVLAHKQTATNCPLYKCNFRTEESRCDHQLFFFVHFSAFFMFFFCCRRRFFFAVSSTYRSSKRSFRHLTRRLFHSVLRSHSVPSAVYLLSYGSGRDLYECEYCSSGHFSSRPYKTDGLMPIRVYT